MNRRLVLGIVLLAFLLGAGYLGYSRFFRAAPAPTPPEHVDDGEKLPTQADFDELAKTDPVKMLSLGLTRYQREVPGGLRCTIEMQERVQGAPKHPLAPAVQVIEVCVRGDVPDPVTKHTAIEVLMKWREGAKVVAFSPVTATLFSEKPEPGLRGQFVTWRKDAKFMKLSTPLPPNNEAAKNESRYCIRDAGIFRTMLRTHEAWKTRQEAGEFKFEFVGTKVVEKTGGRECHIIRRICPRVELDAFELGGTASTDPKVVADNGMTEVVIYVDRERWIQIGTELYRTEPDGTRVTVGTYYFRDVELNPTFADDTFTVAGLKK